MQQIIGPIFYFLFLYLHVDRNDAEIVDTGLAVENLERAVHDLKVELHEVINIFLYLHTLLFKLHKNIGDMVL